MNTINVFFIANFIIGLLLLILVFKNLKRSVKLKRNGLLIFLVFASVFCSAQISIKNDTLHFDNSIKKGAFVWVSSEYNVRLVKYTIRSKKELETAIKDGWSINKMRLPAGNYFIQYFYKKVSSNRIKLNTKKIK